MAAEKLRRDAALGARVFPADLQTTFAEPLPLGLAHRQSSLFPGDPDRRKLADIRRLPKCDEPQGNRSKQDSRDGEHSQTRGASARCAHTIPPSLDEVIGASKLVTAVSGLFGSQSRLLMNRWIAAPAAPFARSAEAAPFLATPLAVFSTSTLFLETCGETFVGAHELAMSLRAAYLALHRQTGTLLARSGVTADQFVVLCGAARKPMRSRSASSFPAPRLTPTPSARSSSFWSGSN